MNTATKIEWTEVTWNPTTVACQSDGFWREFCDRVTVGDCWHGRAADRQK